MTGNALDQRDHLMEANDSGDCRCGDSLDSCDRRAVDMSRRGDRDYRVGNPPAASITGALSSLAKNYRASLVRSAIRASRLARRAHAQDVGRLCIGELERLMLSQYAAPVPTHACVGPSLKHTGDYVRDCGALPESGRPVRRRLAPGCSEFLNRIVGAQS